MKVAVDVLSIREDGSAGGATGFALELIKGLALTQDVEVMVLCADWNIALLKKVLPGNIQFCQMAGDKRITGIRRVDRWINRFLRKFHQGGVLIRNKADILFCPFSAPTYKEKGIPTVSTILDIQHEYYPQFFTPQELTHRRTFYQDIVKKVERVACISDYTKETFCEKYGFPKERAKTIYISIQNRFEKEDEDVLDRFGLRNQRYLVYPANFWEHKNHKLLLNAFAMYAAQGNDLKLVLTGNPLEQADYYKKMLAAMNIEDKTVITGYTTNEELYSILKNAKGLIFPSLFEGFGIPIVEAMYLKKLIACSNLTSLPEIGCEAICYFDPKRPDEILRGIQYLDTHEMTDDIGRQYDEKLLDYKPEVMVQQYLALFREVISKKEELVFQEGVSGLFPDGWSGPELSIQLKGRQGTTFKADLVVPEFLSKALKITVCHAEREISEMVVPGQVMKLEESVDEVNYELIIKIQKPWSPRAVLKSEDERLLGVRVENPILESENGEIMKLDEIFNA